jgi:hypothetical protein
MLWNIGIIVMNKNNNELDKWIRLGMFCTCLLGINCI